MKGENLDRCRIRIVFLFSADASTKPGDRERRNQLKREIADACRTDEDMRERSRSRTREGPTSITAN
jgi:hypothetical protein